MPRYTKKRKLTRNQVARALGGGNKRYLREGRGFEIKSPINDAITWQAIADFGSIENARIILNQDGQEAQAGDNNAHLSYMINKHKIQLHGRNCGAQPCMMKFWVLTNLNDIYGETNSITGSVNPIGTSTNPNMQEICIQDLVYGWDVQMQTAQVNTAFTPDFDADGILWEQTGDLNNTTQWGLTSGTAPNAGAHVLYNHDNPAAGVTNTPTYCLSRLSSLGLHNSKDFLNKWQILKKGDFKLNPGDDYYININVPHLHWKTRPPIEAQPDDTANAGLMYCYAKKGVVILVRAQGCLGISTTTSNGVITSKSGYMKCQIPFEWRESAEFYKMDDVDINLGVQLYSTDDVENTTLSAGTTAASVNGDGGM